MKKMNVYEAPVAEMIGIEVSNNMMTTSNSTANPPVNPPTPGPGFP